MTTGNPNIPFTPVLDTGDIPAGEGRTFEVAGRLIAIFFDGESYHAMDDLCPHMGHHSDLDRLWKVLSPALARMAIPGMRWGLV